MANKKELKIPKKLWQSLIKELKKRGKGKRESGAFLLGIPETDEVIEFVCYDDLDPYCLTGMIEFSSAGFFKLWQLCEEKKLSVLADVHTHPSEWTGQSVLDKTNPMISKAGHIALIVPHFAKIKAQLLEGVGVYEYRGSFKWKKHTNTKIKLN